MSFMKVIECVSKFKQVMISKLEKNQHKGNREGWLKDNPIALLRRVRDEYKELEEAIDNGLPPEEVWKEAADIANMAMMAADSYEVNHWHHTGS